MNEWIINPADHLRSLTEMLCYARGMAAACREVLSIAQDEDRRVPERLQEIVRYHQESLSYKPPKPFPEHPPYHPRLNLACVPEEYAQLMRLLDEVPMHGYIQGKHACRSLICSMALDHYERDAWAILDSIVAFCQAVIDIVEVKAHDGE